MSGQSDARIVRHRDVLAHAMSETDRAIEQLRKPRVRIRQLVPLGRVDDHAVGDAHELLELLRRPNGGSPRQRRKTGRSEMAAAARSLAGAFARVAAQPQLHDLGADVAVDDREA